MNLSQNINFLDFDGLSHYHEKLVSGFFNPLTLSIEALDEINQNTITSAEYISDYIPDGESEPVPTIVFYHDETIDENTTRTIKSTIDASPFLVDGMLRNVEVVKGNKVVDGEIVKDDDNNPVQVDFLKFTFNINFDTDNDKNTPDTNVIYVEIAKFFNADNYVSSEDFDKFKDSYITHNEIEELFGIEQDEETGDKIIPYVLTSQLGDGTLTLKRGNTTKTFTANQFTNESVSIPDKISELSDSATEVLNIIKYGVADISDYTEELLLNLETYGVADISEMSDSELEEARLLKNSTTVVNKEDLDTKVDKVTGYGLIQITDEINNGLTGDDAEYTLIFTVE